MAVCLYISAPALELISRATSSVGVMYRSSGPNTGSSPGGGRILKKKKKHGNGLRTVYISLSSRVQVVLVVSTKILFRCLSQNFFQESWISQIAQTDITRFKKNRRFMIFVQILTIDGQVLTRAWAFFQTEMECYATPWRLWRESRNF